MRPSALRFGRSLGALVPALLLACVTATAALADLRPAPRTGEMAVVFAPWTAEADGLRAIVAAGGRLSSSSRLPNILIAYADDPGFAERVRGLGALALFAATGLCGPRSTSPETTE